MTGSDGRTCHAPDRGPDGDRRCRGVRHTSDRIGAARRGRTRRSIAVASCALHAAAHRAAARHRREPLADLRQPPRDARSHRRDRVRADGRPPETDPGRPADISLQHRKTTATSASTCGPRCPPNDLLAAIAHELQHAVEIAGSVDVRDSRSLGSFYERIGVSRGARTSFDTDAARETGARVKSELLGA